MKLHNKSFLFIAFTILILVLAACGGDKKTSNNNSEGDINENNEQQESENEDNGAPEETYDLGGRTIKINFHSGQEPEEGTEIGDLRYEKWKEVEEKYNVTIEWTETPYDEKYDLFTTTVLAGEPYADIVLFDRSEIGRVAKLAQEELIIPYDDIVDLSQMKVSDAQKELGRINPDGKLYLVHTLICVKLYSG